MEGDEEEDDIDDLENEFDIDGERRDPHHIAEAMLSARLNVGQAHVSGVTTPSEMDSVSVAADVPLLTYSQEVV